MRKRETEGFTLVELLVVVVIIGILAAIALPNFIGAQAKAKAASTKGNMRTYQIASESYATDSGGSYSPSVTAAASAADYLPGGSNTIVGGAAGNSPINPVSGTATVPDNGVVGGTVAAQRALTGGNYPTAGGCSYDMLLANTSYGICGGDPGGKLILGAGGKVMCLSNQ